MWPTTEWSPAILCILRLGSGLFLTVIFNALHGRYAVYIFTLVLRIDMERSGLIPKIDDFVTALGTALGPSHASVNRC